MRRVILLVVVLPVIAIVAIAVMVCHATRRDEPLAPPVRKPSPVRVVESSRVPAVASRAPWRVDASSAVKVVCGDDPATAERYEARNDALRSIARRRDLPEGDIAALMAYLRSQDDAMRIERVAALKNDVMNLLRNQDLPVKGLAETLIAMIEGRPVAGFGRSGRAGVPPPAADGDGTPSLPTWSRDTDGDGTPSLPGNTLHPPVVIDYCIQHLGAMVNELDDAVRKAVRGVFVRAARDKTKPYAGTALYSLADDKSATAAQEGELRRLTVALCKPDACTSARIAAIQLAGQRGYSEVLPILRDTLSGAHRDAVLDIVAIGSVGLLGNADDVALLSRFSSDSRRAAAVEAALSRIKERGYDE